MVLVIICVAIALVVSMSFLNAQSVATGMADSVTRRARARAIAESGLELITTHVRTSSAWRTQFSQGVWIADQPFGGGTFTISAEDGADTNGDGIVEGDGNLHDDHDDPITITSKGHYDGATHVLKAVVTGARPKKRLLLVVPNPTTLGVDDQRRISQFTSWDYDVAIIGENESNSNFSAAFAQADVFYVPETIYSSNLNGVLSNAAIPVVLEEGYLHDDIRISTQNGQEYSGATQINIISNNHFITAPFATGLRAIATSTQANLRSINGTLASGAVVLARKASDSTPVLAVIDAGRQLADTSDKAPARRVVLPWAGSSFNWTHLTTDALTILQRALIWVTQPAKPDRLAHWTLDRHSGTTTTELIAGYNGTLVNGATCGATSPFFETPFAAFDGVDDFIQVAHTSAFLLNNGTFVFWARVDNRAASPGLLSKDSSGLDTGGHLTFSIDAQRISTRLQSTSDSHFVYSPAIEEHRWYHIGFTFGSGGMKLYIDGELVDSNAYTGGMGTSSGGSGNYEPMAIGVSTAQSGDLTTNGWSYPLQGAIEDVQIFSRALSQAEIQGMIRTLNYSVRWIEAADLE